MHLSWFWRDPERAAGQNSTFAMFIHWQKNLSRAMASERQDLEAAIEDVEGRADNAKKIGGVDNIHFSDSQLLKDFGQAIDGIISSMTREYG